MKNAHTAQTAPAHLPGTARALSAYDCALDAWHAHQMDWPTLNALGHAVRDAWIEEDGEPGATLEAIRNAVEAYADTLCVDCCEHPADDGNTCRECDAIARADQADFEREHSAWRLG